MTDHPITPPPELVQQWVNGHYGGKVHRDLGGLERTLATQAARWGADQQLLACGKYLEQCAAWEEEDVTEMYNYLRPKPPSLKEQALVALNEIEDKMLGPTVGEKLIRRALESLPD